MKFQVTPTFPALVQAGSGITITKSNGVYTISGTSELTTLPITGAVANGVTSDLAAFNAAIAHANGAGGNITYRVPMGTMLLDGPPTPILVNNIFFVGEGAAQDCRIKTTNDTGIAWGTPSVVIDGGGMLNVGIDSDSGTNRTSLIMPAAARMRFGNIHVGRGVSILARVGDPGLVGAAAQVEFDGLRGICANTSGGALIQAFNGAGLFLRNLDLVNDAATYSQTAGRAVCSITTGNWDTFILENSLLQNFYSPLVLVSNSGKIFANFLITNSFLDTMLNGPVLISQSGGLIYGVEAYGNEITAHTGVGISAQGAGAHEEYHFSHNRFLDMLGDGISLPGTMKTFSLVDNSLTGFTGPTASAIKVASGARDGEIALNKMPVTALTLIGGIPKYGIDVGDILDTTIIGNRMNGSTAGGNFGTLTNCRVSSNEGYTAGVPDTSFNGIGSYKTATASYTGISHITATDIVGNAASFILPPGDWEVEGLVDFSPAATTNVKYIQAGLSLSSVTMPAIGDTGRADMAWDSASGAVLAVDISLRVRTRFNVAAATPIYLVAFTEFSVSTMQTAGQIRARRI